MLMMLNNLAIKAMTKWNSFLKDEEGDVNIVSIVVLIGIAVLLAIIFRGQIENLLNSLFSTIGGSANNALK